MMALEPENEALIVQQWPPAATPVASSATFSPPGE